MLIIIKDFLSSVPTKSFLKKLLGSLFKKFRYFLLYLEVSKADYSCFLLATDVVVLALKKKFLQASIDCSRTDGVLFWRFGWRESVALVVDIARRTSICSWQNVFII